MLTKRDPDTASRMLAVLGDLLRTVLRRDSQPESTLGEEIDLTRSCVDLEQMRSADRLRVTLRSRRREAGDGSLLPDAALS